MKTLSLGSNPSGTTMIPAKPGIYKTKGQYNRANNLLKKSKKVQDFELIEVVDSIDQLDEALKKYQKPKEIEEQDIVLHHYVNPETKYSITSIFDKQHFEGYIQVD